MASLKDIRRRISSVKNTQQITKAMKMVAAARLRRAQETINGARPFAERIESLTQRIISDLAVGVEDSKREEFLSRLNPLLSRGITKEEDESSAEWTEQPKKRVALIVVTSDKGLCGGYNTNAIRKAARHYAELQSEENTSPELYFVGKKGYEYFKKNGVEGHWFKDFWTGSFNANNTDMIAKIFVDKFISGQLARVEVCYTEFRTALTQIVTHKVLLPLGEDAPLVIDAAGSAAIESASGTEIIYKPNRTVLLDKLIPKQVAMQFFRVFADAMASEFGARMTAMDSATSNAKDMISDLTLLANRVRQAAITTELMEIVSGAEALKG